MERNLTDPADMSRNGSDLATSPYPDCGQPCSGWECDGHNHCCPDCEQSYRDHFESMRPYF